MVRNLHLTKKSGFQVTDPTVPINIRDDRGIMFYTTEPIMPVYSFNLPSGDYIVDTGYFKQLMFPLEFKKAKLPLPEVGYSLPPFNFEIIFAKNPNKCSIFWKQRVIVFDDGTGSGIDFREVPYPQLYFILFHEYGHSLYGYDKIYTMKQSEAYCDLYASNKMIDMGFNPSQITAAPKQTLSSAQDYRKNYIEETLLNNA